MDRRKQVVMLRWSVLRGGRKVGFDCSTLLVICDTPFHITVRQFQEIIWRLFVFPETRDGFGDVPSSPLWKISVRYFGNTLGMVSHLQQTQIC